MKLNSTHTQLHTLRHNSPFRWWMPGAVLFAGTIGVLIYVARCGPDGGWLTIGSPEW